MREAANVVRHGFQVLRGVTKVTGVDAELLAGKRNQLVEGAGSPSLLVDLRGLAVRLPPDFIMAG